MATLIGNCLRVPKLFRRAFAMFGYLQESREGFRKHFLTRCENRFILKGVHASCRKKITAIVGHLNILVKEPTMVLDISKTTENFEKL